MQIQRDRDLSIQISDREKLTLRHNPFTERDRTPEDKHLETIDASSPRGADHYDSAWETSA